MSGPPWKILRTVSKGDYNYAVVPDHPFAIKHGYVLEHRVIMENKLGRLLTPEEVVHHDNEKKKDNRPENLIATSNEDHARYHSSTGRTMISLRCPWCLKDFTKERRSTHLGKKTGSYTCCSRSCRGSLSRSIQIGKPPLDLEYRLAANVPVTQLEEYRLSNPEVASSSLAGDAKEKK